MGKATGFMEIDRIERDYEPVEDRIKHFKEFMVPLSPEKVSEQGARCMDCGIPYCHQGCPVNNLIPDWNEMVYLKGPSYAGGGRGGGLAVEVEGGRAREAGPRTPGNGRDKWLSMTMTSW